MPQVVFSESIFSYFFQRSPVWPTQGPPRGRSSDVASWASGNRSSPPADVSKTSKIYGLLSEMS